MARQIEYDIQAQGQFKLSDTRTSFSPAGRSRSVERIYISNLLRFSVFLIVAHRYLHEVHCIARFSSLRRVGTYFSHIRLRIPHA